MMNMWMFVLYTHDESLSNTYHMQSSLNQTLSTDAELSGLIKAESDRQRDNIELIASENFTSSGVLECLGSVLTNKYSEGRPHRRYYGGNEVIDKIEELCEKRAMEAFRLNPQEWGVNVQPYSGSVANIAACNGLLKPGDTIMGLALQSGGHLSHGFQTPTKKINISSVLYNSVPYHIGSNGYIDYEALECQALEHKPNLIICGGSAYPRDINYDTLRVICDKVSDLLEGDKRCYLMADIAHISGFVATGIMRNPFQFCDLVTSTTHKTLRGPRSGMIFARREILPRINESVFPGVQGGPHNHQIAGLAFQLKSVATPDFRNYMQAVLENARMLGELLKQKGFKLSTDGTDNHILLIDLSNFGISGSKMERVCELVNISLNKNTVYGDKSALSPSGIRIGTSCMTTRAMGRDGWVKLADWLYGCVVICQRRQAQLGKRLVDFNKEIEQDPDIVALSKAVVEYSRSLPFYF